MLTFDDEKQSQLEEIYNEVIFGRNKVCFKVFSTEASLGKTKTIEKALVDLYYLNPSIKTLLVKPFKDRVDEFPSYKKINSLAGKEIAIAVDSDNFKHVRSKLDNYNIVIITHRRYLELCKNVQERLTFTKGRTNLIIDEELQLLKMYSLSKVNITIIEDMLKEISDGYENAGSIFSSIIADVEAQLVEASNEMRLVTFTDGKIGSKVNRLLDFINANINEDYLSKYRESKKGSYNHSYKEIIKIINRVPYFFNNDSVIKVHNSLYAYDTAIKMFLLQNNILLDASASFNYIYSLSNLFKVVPHRRILSHANTTINYCLLNSTKTAKQKYLNYNEAIIEHAVNNANSGKILIIALKEEIDKLKEGFKATEIAKLIDYTNFKSMRGKNQWADYNTCYTTHTPNMNYCYYAFLYELYSGNKLQQRDLDTKKNEYGNLAFSNIEIEKTRKTYIASDIYQGIKRVNRNNKHVANIYIIISDEEILRTVQQQLKNVDYKQFELEIKTAERKQYDSTCRFENSYAGRFLRFLLTAPDGEYSKEDIRLEIGYYEKKTFAEKVIKKAVDFMHKERALIFPCENNKTVILYRNVEITITTRKITINS